VPNNFKELCNRLKFVKAVITDVDGVLNDAKLYYIPAEGGVYISKFFNVKDGLGIKLLKLAGIKFGVITGRKDRVVEYRCKELGCDFFYSGVKDKGKALREIATKGGFKKEELLYVGDDLNDLPAFEEAGVKVVPKDGSKLILPYADLVVPVKGGEGVIRYLVEEILSCKGTLKEVAEKFLALLKEEK